MNLEQPLSIDELRALALASASVTDSCACEIASYPGWTRTPVSFPQAQMRPAGTLAGDPYFDPTFAEYHPHGTNYWSPDAPIAIHYFPYNRCAVQQCGVCLRYCLSYVEAGGYYVEPRIRALDGRHIVDAPVPD
ncbi:hypothetical protein [Massilia arenae]|uniref:Uncharacterized protein n=1 Tax=Massilia arenae TaxID=2603288 RepID=A0A5C7G3Z4_9BURK|nr:hypothetical protein [Massilia arenae]TXF98801.1 hypothetical protein FVD38_16055 [Massilia arenae]